MSSVTFLASAVLTVCVLHAVDQSMVDAVDKIGGGFEEKVELNHVDSVKFKQVVKPADAQAFTPNAQVFNAKKVETILPNHEAEKRVAAKTSSAI